MSELYTIAHCKEQIMAACLVINTPYQTVKTLYQNKEINATCNCSRNEEKELLLEIKFENATLNCLFNNRNICDRVFIILNYPGNLIHYAEYCSKTFQYNCNSRSWINGGCMISIHIESHECGLIILPIKSVGT